MLKKTAAMAVLVLMIASLFSGSLGRGQADVPATMIEAAEYAQERQQAYLQEGPEAGHQLFLPGYHRTVPPVPGEGEMLSFGTSGAAGGMDATGPGAVFTFAGIPPEGGVIVTGQASSDSPKLAYTSMVVYMNDSELRIPMPGPGDAWKNNGTARPFPHVMSAPAFEPGVLSINGKVAMFRAGSVAPDWFDMRWENKQDVRFGEKVSRAVFTGHLVIPHANGTEAIPLSGSAFPGEYVLDSSITVDLANLTLVDSVTSQDGLYDNEIAAGETRWHTADIADDVESVNIDLKWRDGGNPLKLTIYTPDGHVLGPYDDASDGKTDGRINLNVASPSGVADGEWCLKVTDTGVTGNDQYYVKTY